MRRVSLSIELFCSVMRLSLARLINSGSVYLQYPCEEDIGIVLLLGNDKNMTDVDARKEDFGRAKGNLDGERKEADEQAHQATEEADSKQKEAVK